MLYQKASFIALINILVSYAIIKSITNTSNNTQQTWLINTQQTHNKHGRLLS